MAETGGATRLEWTPLTAGDDRRVAVVTLDLPGKSANLLSAAVLDELEGRFDEVDAAGDAAGLIIASAKPGVFIAGADLTEFAAGIDRPAGEVVAMARRGQALFARLSACDYVTVAAIDGVCVGGGMELAVWCDRRVATDSPKTQLGFPEVKLGLFPGWGGTARTPRMIGLANAVEMVTGGENLDARRAAALGLLEDVIRVDSRESGVGSRGEPGASATGAESPVVAAALRLIADEQRSGAWRKDRERWSAPIQQSETELAFLGATASAVIQQKTGGRYPAPMAALELMLEASQGDLAAACDAEAEAFAPLFGSPVNRALLNVFFLTDRGKKSGQRADAGGAEIATAAVVGAGTMGQGIAAANLKRGVRVLLSDTREVALAKGVAGAVREASFNKQTRSTDADLAIERGAMIDGVTDAARIARADIVIEAIVEDADVKRALLAELEPHAGERTILASNTSTIPITSLAHGLKRPERFVGLHFFNPVRKMPLVEVIRGAQTSDETVAAMAAYARKLGKTPVVVGDGPGFLVNRLLLPYMQEAAVLAAEGAPFKKIEKAAKAFGMPMGPLELHDVVGLDVCLHAGRVMQRAFSDRVVPAPLLERLVEAGRLGQKNGKGFFDYKPGKPGKPPKSSPSAEAEALAKAASGEAHGDAGDLTDRLLLPMLLEATRAIEDGVVADPRDVDLALILGIGFPPHRGGLLFWADTVGADEILKRLEPLAPLGKRFEPTPLLRACATNGEKFYG